MTPKSEKHRPNIAALAYKTAGSVRMGVTYGS